jgi:hypothetical protein
MRREVLFAKNGEECVSQGRSGTIKTVGIELLLVPGFPPKLSPITRSGTIGNCYIEFDRRAIPALIRALREIPVKEE